MLVTAMTAKPVISRASWSGERAVGLSMLADTGGCRVSNIAKISMLINCIRIACRPQTGAGRGREDSMSREYPDQPLVGLGAIVWKDGRVLMVKRGRPPGEGIWSLPGGLQLVEIGRAHV